MRARLLFARARPLQAQKAAPPARGAKEPSSAAPAATVDPTAAARQTAAARTCARLAALRARVRQRALALEPALAAAPDRPAGAPRRLYSVARGASAGRRAAHRHNGARAASCRVPNDRNRRVRLHPLPTLRSGPDPGPAPSHRALPQSAVARRRAFAPRRRHLPCCRVAGAEDRTCPYFACIAPMLYPLACRLRRRAPAAWPGH